MSTSIDCYFVIFMISALFGLSEGNVTDAATLTNGLPQTSRPRLDGRIVGGVAVDIKDVPYQASLLKSGSHICGAAIVGWNICLTAAHCTDGSQVSQLSVRLGSSIRNEGGEVYGISIIIQHPNYNSQTIDSDISILILANEISFGPGINSIALASQSAPAGAEAVVSGWGATSEGGSSAQQLQQVAIPVVSNAVCEEIYGAAGVDSDAACNDNPACLRCSPVKGCLKCAVLITQPDRRCVTQCPSGARAQWSTRVDYMGRVCVQRGTSINGAGAESMLLGMTNDSLTLLTGVIAGSVICILIISFAIVYVQYKKKTLEQVSETSSELDESNHSGYQQQHHQGHETDRRSEFLRQVDELRPHAATFLEMLNDTRRQLRQAHRAGDGGAATAVFRPVICDLAKILILLNRRPDIFISEVQQHQMPPDDWEHLFDWAEKNLKRYKRMSEVSQPQVAQLINFLQAPSVVIDTGIQQREKDPACSGANIQVMSTFKPDQSIGSTLSLQDVAIKNFNANYGTAQAVLNPQWKFDYALAASTNLPISQFNPNVWKNGTNQYFLEDDFGQLGFRPQDEITTEL